MTTPINLGLSPHAWEQMLAEAWVEAKKRSREAKDKAEHGISWPTLSEYRNSETGYKYEPHSEAELAWVQDTTSTNLWALGGEGGGKALALDTPLAAPSGWTTMGDVRAGEWLFDEQGRPCRVLRKSEVMLGRPCYRVQFTDGQSIIADEGHLWMTLDEAARKSLARRGKKWRNGLHRLSPQCQPSRGPRVVTTREIAETVCLRPGVLNHAIPLAAPLDLPDAILPIPPYVLGYWLGDGNSNGSGLTIGQQDQEQAIALLEAEGEVLTRRADPLSFGVTPAGIGINMRPEAFLARLRGLGVIGNKHIPQTYLRASIQQRMALLQGLMDTDGSIGKNGSAEFTTISDTIADDFHELATSLMIKVRRRSHIIQFNGAPYHSWRFAFKAYTDIFRLDRKAERIPDARRHAVRQFRRSISAVIAVPSVPVQCIQVDSPSHLYLAGRGMIPTHNSVVGIIRDLERAKVGCAGAIVSPDFEHHKRSLWPELRRWIPWDLVIQRHRYRASASWEPQRPFTLVFLTGSAFFLGGMQESDVQAWEGPNLNFWHFDEIRRHRTDAALKVIHGRVRVPGPNGEKPQRWYTTTPLPRGSWMFKYTGPIPEEKEQRLQDPRLRYKLDRLIVNLKTKDNLAHLTPGFIEERSQVLSESEIQLLLEGLQVDVADTEAFLPTISLWDECRGVVPPLDDRTPIVIALDAAIGRASGLPDCFGLVGVSRQKDRPDDLAVRIVRKWQAEPGKKLDFHADNGPIPTLRFLCEHHAVAAVPYDPYQLHSDCTQLAKEGFAWFMEFHQGADRLEADRALFDRILARGIIHDGNADLRQHLENAGRKLDADGRRMRIVQRDPDLKVDLAVCLSMAAVTASRLSL